MIEPLGTDLVKIIWIGTVLADIFLLFLSKVLFIHEVNLPCNLVSFP